jgi:hypothetical protein
LAEVATMNEGQQLWFQYVALLNREPRARHREGREARLDRACRSRLARSAKAGWPQAVAEVARQAQYRRTEVTA